MDEIYVLSGTCIMVFACFLQYKITLVSRNYIFLLPFIFGVLTFWLGLISLLFAFALIFVGELAPFQRQKDRTDVF